MTDHDKLLLELGDLNERIANERQGAFVPPSLLAEREALIARIRKPAQISINAHH